MYFRIWRQRCDGLLCLSLVHWAVGAEAGFLHGTSRVTADRHYWTWRVTTRQAIIGFYRWVVSVRGMVRSWAWGGVKPNQEIFKYVNVRQGAGITGFRAGYWMLVGLNRGWPLGRGGDSLATLTGARANIAVPSRPLVSAQGLSLPWMLSLHTVIRMSKARTVGYQAETGLIYGMWGPPSCNCIYFVLPVARYQGIIGSMIHGACRT